MIYLYFITDLKKRLICGMLFLQSQRSHLFVISILFKKQNSFCPIISYMKKILFLTGFSLLAFWTFGQSQEDALLKLLDNTVRERPRFTEIKELRLDSLKTALGASVAIEDKYLLYNTLFNEYKQYNLDSALLIAKKKNAIAGQLNNAQYQYESRMNIAEILGKMGSIEKTFDILGQIRKNDLDKNQWGYYFHLYHSIYSLLLQNALSQEEKEHYKKLLLGYKDSLLQVLDPQTLAYKLVMNGKLIESGKYPEALMLMNQCYDEYKENGAEIGTIANSIADIYERKAIVDSQKKYLSIAARADLRKAVKSYIALRKLAVVLYREGDMERAYAYIKCAMEDASFAKARFRMIEISEALPIIVASYDNKMKEEKDNLFKYLVLISVLSFILLVSIAFIYKQLKKISAAKKLIKKANEDLMAINAELTELNKEIIELDHVKEMYIGYVFNLCSSYINKLENYRLILNKKLKARQIDEALKITGGASLVTNELKEFFQNFDAVFLNLYPNFIDEFNGLLKTEERIVPKADNILTPELRVFALTRLGISDSSKIAGFLHYSPQTVYNYKLKIKNKLAISKDDFSRKILRIGR